MLAREASKVVGARCWIMPWSYLSIVGVASSQFIARVASGECQSIEWMDGRTDGGRGGSLLTWRWYK